MLRRKFIIAGLTCVCMGIVSFLPFYNVSVRADALKGACVIRDAFTSAPLYSAPDSEAGYAKVNKGSDFTSMDQLQGSCLQDDYNSLDSIFCAANPGSSYQRSVILYELDDSINSSTCSNLGCSYIQCAVAITPSSSGGAAAHKRIRERYAEIQAGFTGEIPAGTYSDMESPSLRDVGIFAPKEESKVQTNIVDSQEGVETSDKEEDSTAESAGVLSSFEQRVCKRVHKRFSGSSLDRVNKRLLNRLGFVCKI